VFLIHFAKVIKNNTLLSRVNRSIIILKIASNYYALIKICNEGKRTKIFPFSPDCSGILFLFKEKRKRYSEKQDPCLQKHLMFLLQKNLESLSNSEIKTPIPTAYCNIYSCIYFLTSFFNYLITGTSTYTW